MKVAKKSAVLMKIFKNSRSCPQNFTNRLRNETFIGEQTDRRICKSVFVILTRRLSPAFNSLGHKSCLITITAYQSSTNSQDRHPDSITDLNTRHVTNHPKLLRGSIKFCNFSTVVLFDIFRDRTGFCLSVVWR